MYRITQLPSGMRVVTAAMPQMESVTLGVWIGVGGRYESKRLCGISHFIEHLLFKGTARRSAKQISQTVEGVGGYLNAFTGEESTCYYAKASHRHLDTLRSEEHTSELQSPCNLVCRLLLEKKKKR